MAHWSFKYALGKELKLSLLLRTARAMARQCWKASPVAGLLGHFCPCLWDRQSAMCAVTQHVKAQVISRTDN